MTSPSSVAVPPRRRSPIVRHLVASSVDAFVILIVPILWWHWAEWAQYTRTFGRRWPAQVAFIALTIIPLTGVWVEAVTGRGLGKWLTRLKVTATRGGQASLTRRLARAALKWSPAWAGPVIRIVCQATGSAWADDWTFDSWLAFSDDPSNRLDEMLRRAGAALGVSLKGMNAAVLLWPILIVGYLGVLLPGGRGLLDRLTGTRVSRA